MPAYADLTSVKAMLNISGDDADARLNALNTSLSALMDDELGRTFPAQTVAETRTVTQDAGLATLWLPWPLVSLRDIEVGGTWDGLDWTDPTVLVTEDYRLHDPDRRGYAWGIDLYGATADTYRVTGTWADQDGTAPEPVVEALNVLVSRAYKKDEAGPDGTIVGPDALQVRPENGWNDDRVTRAIAQYRLVEHVL